MATKKKAPPPNRSGNRPPRVRRTNEGSLFDQLAKLEIGETLSEVTLISFDEMLDAQNEMVDEVNRLRSKFTSNISRVTSDDVAKTFKINTFKVMTADSAQVACICVVQRGNDHE